MIRRAVRTLLLVLLATPVAAQESLLPTVRAVMAQYPDRPLTDAQLGEAMNEIARRHSDWGLHRDIVGRFCPLPNSSITIDCNIVVSPTGEVYDVLLDEDGEAIPTWRLVGPIDTMTNFVTPAGAPEPQPSPDDSLGDLQAQQAAVVEMQRQLKLAIQNFNEQSSQQAATMIRLTWVILSLTVVFGVIAAVQVWAMLKGRA